MEGVKGGAWMWECEGEGVEGREGRDGGEGPSGSTLRDEVEDDAEEERASASNSFRREVECDHASSDEERTTESRREMTARKKSPRAAPNVLPALVGVQPSNQRVEVPRVVMKKFDIIPCMEEVELAMFMSGFADEEE